MGLIDSDKLLELIEKERAIAFLTLANTGDEKQDFAYEQVTAYIDRIKEIINQNNNNSLCL